MMEHEESYTLMMAALDGRLDAAGRQQMDTHLRLCPACGRQWRLLLAIHALFSQAPLLSPAAGFSQRTLARLPNGRGRLWLAGAIYLLLLLIGLAPLLLLAVLAVVLWPALGEPAVVGSLLQAGRQAAGLGGALFGAAGRGLLDLGPILAQNPAILGWLLVMLAAVGLWAGVYGRLTQVQIPQTWRRSL
ncbi:MAG: anti-sigma factor family protein [Candidatus Promineifilaceae bacterium]